MSIKDITSIGKENFDIGSSNFAKQLAKNGRLPGVFLYIYPLDKSPRIKLTRFLSYEFNSSILVPVDSFSFTYSAPDDEQPVSTKIKCGDIVVLEANGTTLATGLIDQVDIETQNSDGEQVSIVGRDLMAQFEDNDAISLVSDPLWGQRVTINQVVSYLTSNTRINSTPILRQAPADSYLFATEPTDTKLTALLRYLESLNCLAWMSPEGKLIIGRPTMSQPERGVLFMKKKERKSNVLSIRVTRNSTKIPNIIVPIWTGQENVQSIVGKSQKLLNNMEEPTRLRKFNHLVIKTVVVSNPQVSDPQDGTGAAGVNQLLSGNQNLLQAYAKRELARSNINEKIVQVVVGGHYNERGEPYTTDTVYKIIYDRGNVDESMYLFDVQYKGSNEEGQRTILKFAPLGTIVSDIKFR